MISMDEQKAQQVWSRVMNVSAPCPAKDGTEGAQLSAETVAALTQAEWQDAATYRTLATRAPKCARERLLCLAEEERCHARQLGALYFLMTGKKLCPEPMKPVCTACFNETIRQRYQAELAGQAQYQALAARAGERRCTFEALAADEGRHAQLLYCLLQQTL